MAKAHESARVYNAHADLGHRTDQLKLPSYEYRRLGREAFEQANGCYAQNTALRKEVRDMNWQARKHSAISTVQKAAGWLGFSGKWLYR